MWEFRSNWGFLGSFESGLAGSWLTVTDTSDAHTQLARALEPFNLKWIEEFLPPVRCWRGMVDVVVVAWLFVAGAGGGGSGGGWWWWLVVCDSAGVRGCLHFPVPLPCLSPVSFPLPPSSDSVSLVPVWPRTYGCFLTDSKSS